VTLRKCGDGDGRDKKKKKKKMRGIVRDDG
jgi:hypothetical protein